MWYGLPFDIGLVGNRRLVLGDSALETEIMAEKKPG
jgi:hypothetical protein